MSTNSKVTLTFEILSGNNLIRTFVRCPVCKSGTFSAILNERPITRVVCSLCGTIYTFHSSLLVPLKQLSKNG